MGRRSMWIAAVAVSVCAFGGIGQSLPAEDELFVFTVPEDAVPLTNPAGLLPGAVTPILWEWQRFPSVEEQERYRPIPRALDTPGYTPDRTPEGWLDLVRWMGDGVNLAGGWAPRDRSRYYAMLQMPDPSQSLTVLRYETWGITFHIAQTRTERTTAIRLPAGQVWAADPARSLEAMLRRMGPLDEEQIAQLKPHFLDEVEGVRWYESEADTPGDLAWWRGILWATDGRTVFMPVSKIGLNQSLIVTPSDPWF